MKKASLHWRLDKFFTFTLPIRLFGACDRPVRSLGFSGRCFRPKWHKGQCWMCIELKEKEAEK